MDNYFILSAKVGDKWGQSSSQHDKCQVGDMHTYCWDLVDFPIFSMILPIISSIIQSSSQSLMSMHTPIEISFVSS